MGKEHGFTLGAAGIQTHVTGTGRRLPDRTHQRPRPQVWRLGQQAEVELGVGEPGLQASDTAGRGDRDRGSGSGRTLGCWSHVGPGRCWREPLLWLQQVTPEGLLSSDAGVGIAMETSRSPSGDGPHELPAPAAWVWILTTSSGSCSSLPEVGVWAEASQTEGPCRPPPVLEAAQPREPLCSALKRDKSRAGGGRKRAAPLGGRRGPSGAFMQHFALIGK